MTGTPTSVTIFSYQVGFGDCFLLRFNYDGDRPRHVLIDFGTTGLPDDVERDQMVKVATDIGAKCGGRLEAVVATHRHADHISGFATNQAETASGNIIRGLDIELVIQPWTEAPDAEVDSLGPEIVDSDKRSMAARQRALNAMHGMSEQVLAMLESKALRRAAPAVRDQLEFLGRDNLKNAAAVENLMTMGRRNIYAYHGSDAGLGELLPGVETIVLGPPTLRQTETIRKQKSRDPDEYWHLSLSALEADRSFSDEGVGLFPGHETFPASKLPMETRWIAGRIDEARAGQFLSLVRALDRQMNNTSLILLFEAGGKKLLFSGDAQIENWRYALSSEFAAKLDEVDLYKVGHHGSLNATPKSLWNRFAKKGGPDTPDRLKTLLSTMKGKHGHEKDDTEVPRQTLVNELDSKSELHSTERMNPGELYQEITIAL